MKVTPESLIDAAKAYLKADGDRMAKRPTGMRRAEWRWKNPIDQEQRRFLVVDTAMKTRPHRIIKVATSARHVTVWGAGKRRAFVVEHIDLRAPDAAARLTRYEGI